ncbi:MAG: hypothetical protein KGM24_11925 [Elusimicrobia bacterium]|nr:hypothetical protein [Elusimicrobiota bacterium]
MTATPLALKRLNIFEVVNSARRESLIALSSGDAGALRRRVRASPPPEIRHWDRADALEFETLAMRLNPSHAEHFLTLFLSNPQLRDWRLIAWRDDGAA